MPALILAIASLVPTTRSAHTTCGCATQASTMRMSNNQCCLRGSITTTAATATTTATTVAATAVAANTAVLRC
eukprot:2507-Heterococcus_DN1.PRE.8